MELTVVASLGCSLWTWGREPVSRIPEFYAFLGSILIILGFSMRRWTWILGGLLVLTRLLFVILIWNSNRIEDRLWYEQLSLEILQPDDAVPAIDVAGFADDAGGEVA